jgi:pSer/pThr/pTyr-binding forkhead associated (FHA) protein
MSDSILTVLKFCLLALLYLFLVRVVWIVARELRGTPAPATVVAAPAPSTAPRSRKRGWRLVVVEPKAEQGQAFAIDDEATMGRGGGCGIPLTFDTFVSQVHARAFDRDGNLWVEDLGSTNGTFVNGDKLTQAIMLKKGDRVKVGETVLEAERA